MRRGKLAHGRETLPGRKKVDVLGIHRALEVLEHLALGFRRPKDPQMASRSGNGGIEDAMRQVVFI